MEGVELIRESKTKAKEEYTAYKDALAELPQILHTQVEQAYKDLAGAYGHMRHGRALIDVRQAVRDTGFREDGWPHLAIARADYRQCFCLRNRNGRVIFSGRRWGGNWGGIQSSARKEDVDLGAIQEEDLPSRATQAQTAAPLIPPKLLPKDGLDRYYLLWEAEDWTNIRIAPRDPMLLSRVNDTIFGILATWEMTELERTVLGGRIA